MTSARTAALGLALLLACTPLPQSGGPVPLAITPSQSAAAQPVPVEIAGRDFDARVQTDFGKPGDSKLEAAFAVRLEPVDGGAAVWLADASFTERRTLRATVPAGIPRGLYRLVVTDPRGRSGALEQAYRVVSSADSVASFRVEVLEPPLAGVAFAVSLTAIDALGETVDGFNATANLSDLTGTASPGSLGPFVLGRFQGQVVIPGLAAADHLVAGDSLGHSGSSDPFDVVAGPPMAAVFPGAPVSASAGTCSPAVEVELRDAFGNPAPAQADVDGRLDSAPPGLAFFSDPGCTSAASSLAIPAGASRASFHFQGATAGPMTVRLLPGSLPSAAQTETVLP